MKTDKIESEKVKIEKIRPEEDIQGKTKPKVDRRVKRTKRMLGEAMLALVVEQKYDGITINDITKRADVNRATFYLHYASKDELLLEALEAKFEELVSSFEAISTEFPVWGSSKSDLMTFQHVADHAELYKVILGEQGMGYIINRILDYIAEISEKLLRASLPPDAELPIPVELIARHYAGSMYALLSWWVLNDMPYPAEYMASLSEKMCIEGVKPMFGEYGPA
ncbi:MAG: TetR/AcrR family transcriptional regulator [Chloroflexota bacterium]